VFADAAAAAAGLCVGDFVVGIGDQPSEGMTHDAFIEAMQQPGPLKLDLVRRSSASGISGLPGVGFQGDGGGLPARGPVGERHVFYFPLHAISFPRLCWFSLDAKSQKSNRLPAHVDFGCAHARLKCAHARLKCDLRKKPGTR
jgi:hypothetical protein